MTEIIALRGPLDDERLGWIAALYGPVDAKYASLHYVRHQFVENPFGWAVHTFVMDGNRAAGHCAAVPFRANFGGDELVAGKIEAVVLAEDQRGRRIDDGRSLAVAMLAAMYASAHEHGIPVLFGLAPPAVAAVHARAGCERRRVPDQTYVGIATPRADTATGKRRVAMRLLAGVQRALIAAVPRLHTDLATAGAKDVTLVAIPPPRDGSWTISGETSWAWYVGSGLLHVVETRGRAGARALIRLADTPGADVQIVAWQPRGQALASAVLLLAAVARLARARGARTIRFQPWAGTAGDGALARACRLLGFVRRAETELVLNAATSQLAVADVQLTPFFYVTF